MTLFDKGMVKRIQQFFYIVKVKASCRLIENKKNMPLRFSLAKEGSQFYALRFAAGQGIGDCR